MPTLESARILLVDDQALVRIALKHMLAALGTHQVQEAASGEEAIAVLLEQPIDLVISDIDMAPQNGMEFLRNIRTGNYGMRRDTRLIMLTGLTAPEVANACINLDVNAFLNKPAKKDLLERRLQFALTAPMTLESVAHYQQQELPTLIRAQPMVSKPVSTPAPSPSPSRAPAPTGHHNTPDHSDNKAAEFEMTYIIWHERYETGVAEADGIVREAARRLNATYRARGPTASMHEVEQLVQEWQSFTTTRLSQLEFLLAATVAPERLVSLARVQREFVSALSRLWLLLQATPDIASYELFDAARKWWSGAFEVWRRRSES